MTARDKRLEKAQMGVFFRAPFFAVGVAKLSSRFSDAVPTACTDGREIIWNPEFFDSLKDEELITVLCHEVCHPLLGHLWRIPPIGGDMQIANIAADHEVNLMLKDFSEKVTARGLADPFPFPGKPEDYCADPQFKGLACETIYARLASNQPPQGGNGSQNASGRSGAGKAQGKQIAPSGNSGANPSGQSASKPSIGEFKPQNGQNEVAGPSSSKALRNDWEATLMQACQIAQGRGELPGSMERFVNQLVKPQIPWTEILRSWLREQCCDDWDFLECSMEFEGSGFILPSLKSEKMGPVVFATDTSRSINHELLAKFQCEKQACLDDMRPSKLVDIYCDATIQKVVEYRQGEVIALDAPGGGGTDLTKVFEHLERSDTVPKCAVILTDLDTPFPKMPPNYPVIWVTWSKLQAPFGETVQVSD